MVTIALATIVLLSGILFNNARINDVKEVLRADMRADRAEINARFDRLESKIDTLLKLQADMDARISHLEDRR